MRSDFSSRPLVSGVIIFLDEELFLEEAIRSVFAQTYDNWELMLVDDGSTDGSTAIARRYAQDHPERVRYLEHPGHQNRGMSASRNLGFRQTTGRYIALLDGDDVWFPNKLEEQVAILNAHPDVAMTYGRTRFWYGWTDNPDDRKREWFTPLGVKPNQTIPPPVLVTNFLRNESTVVSNCSVLVRREAIEEVEGWEESFRTLYEDMVLWTKIFTRWPVFVSDGCWDLYRQHTGNSVVEAAQSGVWDPAGPNAARQAFLNWVSDYVRQRGVFDRELLSTLAEQLLPYQRLARDGKVHRATSWMRPLRAAASRLRHRMSPGFLLGRPNADVPAAEYLPAIGHVRFGELRRLEPVSRDYGFDRGTPVDRFYIEAFLRRHAKDIRGRVLEFGDSSYTRAFGGNRCTVSDVWHGGPGNTGATIAADLSNGEGVASDLFDCIVCTQVLFLIYDIQAAARTLFRILKPGGVLLVTVPGIAKIEHDSGDFSQDCWRLTERSARLLFEESFPSAYLSVSSHGNVSSTVAFLEGVAAEELPPTDFEHHDPRYPLIVSVRAVKPSTGSRVDASRRHSSPRAACRVSSAPGLDWRTGVKGDPKVRQVEFGDLRRTAPISRRAERDRGKPVDRYYIDWFLSSHADDIRGRVLEIGDDTYTRRLGGDSVTRSEVLKTESVNPISAVVDDLVALAEHSSGMFDCVILPQTLHLIYDVGSAIKATYRVLNPGGVVLATFPGISRLASDPETDSQCWNFTSRSARRKFAEVFPPDGVSIVVRGNVLAAIALMHGLATEELTEGELDHVDSDYELLIGVRASKATSGERSI